MKQTNVLQILTYLFENYMQNDLQLTVNTDILFAKLEQMGFEPKVINHAFEWLDGLIEKQKTATSAPIPSHNSFRIFTELERLKIDLECQSLLYSLEKIGLLTPMMRELVIDRVIELNNDKVSLQQIKWITLMVLFNQTGAESALACMEQFILNEAFGLGH
jgi:Smg protein